MRFLDNWKYVWNLFVEELWAFEITKSGDVLCGVFDAKVRNFQRFSKSNYIYLWLKNEGKNHHHVSMHVLKIINRFKTLFSQKFKCIVWNAYGTCVVTKIFQLNQHSIASLTYFSIYYCKFLLFQIAQNGWFSSTLVGISIWFSGNAPLFRTPKISSLG